MVRCSIRTSKEEEDKVEEIEADLDEANTTKSNPVKRTSTTNKTHQTREAESPEERRTSLLDQAIVMARSNEGTMENSTTTRTSAKRRSETLLRLVYNSRIMH